MQQGQVLELKKRAGDGGPVWAYRYRTGGPGSRRPQRGGFSPKVTRRKHSDGRSNFSGGRTLDSAADIKAADVQAMDVRWTQQLPIVAAHDNGNTT
jgi:hypothetical protein